jgi:hypothetical protein
VTLPELTEARTVMDQLPPERWSPHLRDLLDRARTLPSEDLSASERLAGYLYQATTIQVLCTPVGRRNLQGGASFGLDDFLLRYGQVWTGPPARPRGVRKGVPRHCFSNAVVLASRDPDRFVYCEGKACGIIPVHHAWVVDRHTHRIVDNTWTKQPGTVYLGVPLTIETVWEVIAGQHSASVLDAWEKGWPLLTGKIAPERFLAALSPTPFPKPEMAG